MPEAEASLRQRVCLFAVRLLASPRISVFVGTTSPISNAVMSTIQELDALVKADKARRAEQAAQREGGETGGDHDPLGRKLMRPMVAVGTGVGRVVATPVRVVRDVAVAIARPGSPKPHPPPWKRGGAEDDGGERGGAAEERAGAGAGASIAAAI